MGIAALAVDVVGAAGVFFAILIAPAVVDAARLPIMCRAAAALLGTACLPGFPRWAGTWVLRGRGLVARRSDPAAVHGAVCRVEQPIGGLGNPARAGVALCGS